MPFEHLTNPPVTRLRVYREQWPLAATFTISRGSKHTADVVVAELERDGVQGRGECVPYGRYGETVAGVVSDIERLTDAIAKGLDRTELQQQLGAGAARNALDCAFWDLEAKSTKTRVASMIGLDKLQPVVTAYTLSLDTPEQMGQAACQQAGRPLLKLKLDGRDDLDRVKAVRANASQATIIVDANESWSPATVEPLSRALRDLDVALIEQPLPAAKDAPLAEMERPVPICADESCHLAADVGRLQGKYDAVNIKLDKSGGLTAALELLATAQENRLNVMVGCMVGTSLAMAPALMLAQKAQFVDLDGPLLLAEDRIEGLTYDGSTVYPPLRGLWG